MAIIKIKKKENPFIQIDKTGIQDGKLSWKATGLLTYLIGLPEDWKIHLSHLSKQKKDGLDSTKSALKELRENNYCHYFEIRKKGKIVETFYMVYEIPTPYTEELLKEIESEYENLEEQNLKIFYKKVSSNKNKNISDSPKVENPLLVKSEEKSGIQPKVDFPLATKPLVEDPHLLIINNTNIESTNKKIMIHDELDFFDKLFNEEFKIPFHYKNQESVKKLLKQFNNKQSDVVSYLRETYKNIKENSEVKNLAALFTQKIAKGERQINSSKKILKTKENIIDKKNESDLVEKSKTSISKEENNKKIEKRKRRETIYQENYVKLDKSKKNEIDTIVFNKYLKKAGVKVAGRPQKIAFGICKESLIKDYLEENVDAGN